MRISQIFGPTIQGEGPAAGRHCLFVRTYNCNLECTWCDTAYTWADTPEKAAKTASGHQYDRSDPELGLKEMSVDQVLKELDGLWNVREHPTVIVVSGGEPMMQQKELAELAGALRAWRNEVHVETAGTIAPTYEMNMAVTQYIVSPKLEHSGNLLDRRYKPEVLRLFRGSGKAWFKFVIRGGPLAFAEFKEVDKIVKECGIPANRVQVMPEGTAPEDLTRRAQRIVDEALKRGYGLSLRSHVLLWGTEPGR